MKTQNVKLWRRFNPHYALWLFDFWKHSNPRYNECLYTLTNSKNIKAGKQGITLNQERKGCIEGSIWSQHCQRFSIWITNFRNPGTQRKWTNWLLQYGQGSRRMSKMPANTWNLFHMLVGNERIYVWHNAQWINDSHFNIPDKLAMWRSWGHEPSGDEEWVMGIVATLFCKSFKATSFR